MRGITPQEGFTLVELIVTIAVMAIIAMMAAPSMSNLLESKRLDTNQRDLISTLSEAKSQAVLGRQNVSVKLNSAASNTATLLNWQPTSNNTLTLKNIAADNTQSSLAITTLTFNANGVVSNITQDALISICNSRINKKKNFILTKLGALVFKAEETC
ncbi:prepilin-type cleavage/methylation domain-containing protein [Acinetobacter nosocomialis]|uniref:pilus assembly FimT family protein n=1 Tax=Acinetobacter calcoaceticus/baumannii complex TaxID=909768 RepID=UPI000D0B8CE5|nr:MULTISPECIES: GspH/FimT family pseudopilin [Acinetobacter calcoaceticus/baumannii complex]MDE1703467.1 GspH/FimT family pseudopilin [Acinetobacter nosocomialis]PSE45068.1 prepilin-type cleavage/methylation domain-containing protein [Acinetobacter nosocomialis]PSE86293.1 prepilin-type cleavage/methylation domain-containing protein [Acinetobacter nosocomialis]TLH02090.1 prepilin-type N-terminal cleavage/methylation domain-containing protein [Acinetobacter baumannii]HDG7210006.1 GspH/FimT fami